MTAKQPRTAPAGRLASLDQFRGYTVVGMILVNLVGGFAAVPAVLKHHNTYCSYADTIMPQFFLAVGFAARLTLLRRLARDGRRPAYRHAVGRSVALLVLGFVVYHLDGRVKTWSELKTLGLSGFFAVALQREYFQTLVHIGLASLWTLPVIARGPRARIAWAVGSSLVHLGLSSGGYYSWVTNRPGIDGGPLGFLTWTIPLLVGTFAYDIVTDAEPRAILRMLTLATALMALGYGLTAADGRLDAPPFCPPVAAVDLWTMSQRAGSLTYLTFASGFALAVYAGFAGLADVGRVRFGIFRTFGRNALVAYLLHPMVGAAVRPYVPDDAPAPYVAAGFALELGLTYLIVRHLERDGVEIKL